MNIRNVKNGDTVKLKTSWGAGPVVTGVVTAVENDINNGRPGIEYTLDGYALNDPAGGRWAYMDQVTEVSPQGC